VPTVLDMLDPDEKDTVRNGRTRVAHGVGETDKL
jgi:hypothetical protein